jgi:hypothetical protein
MEEIAIIFSSLAGACTAIVIDKVPKIKRNKQNLMVSSVVQNQLQSLKMEKEILTKTITRLQQQDFEVSKIQKDKLLIRYQHQIGIVIAKLDKLETASKYPDIGPIGDSIISMMDTRLSQLDQRLHEISTKISINNIDQPRQFEKLVATQEKPQIKKVETKIEIQTEKIEIKERSDSTEEKKPIILPSLEIPMHEKHRMVELSTLTEITNKIPEFPVELIKSTRIESQIPLENIKPEIVANEQILETSPIVQELDKEKTTSELLKPELVQQEIEKKIQLPAAMKIPEEEKLDDDDKDLDKIKSEIMKALSKLEQVEVE